MKNRKMIYLDDAIDALERKKDKKANGDIGGFYNKIIQNDIDTLMQLPPAQPEIIRCKDCKHYRTTGAFGTPLRKKDYWCDAENFPDEGQKELPEWWFCAGAERREE